MNNTFRRLALSALVLTGTTAAYAADLPQFSTPGATVSADSSTPGRLRLATEPGSTYTIELLGDDSAIREISSGSQLPEITVSNRRIYASTPGDLEVYDLAGARHNPGQCLEPGFYVVRTGSATSRVVRVAPGTAAE